jgi:hypothetical protein
MSLRFLVSGGTYDTMNLAFLFKLGGKILHKIQNDHKIYAFPMYQLYLSFFRRNHLIHPDSHYEERFMRTYLKIEIAISPFALVSCMEEDENEMQKITGGLWIFIYSPLNQNP